MIVLAQTDSGDIGGFMQQPFVGPVLAMVCVFGVLLIAVVATLIFVRRRKMMQNRASTPPAPSFYGDTGGHEMPDLDILVNTAGLAQPPPAVAAPPPPARTPRKGTFVVAVNDGDATEAVEIMTILRDVVDGRLIVQMGDKAYQSVNNDPDFKERFNKVMRELAQVVGKPTAASVPASPAPAEPAAEPQPSTEEPAEPEAPTPSLADLMQPAVDPSPTPKLRPAPPPPSATGALPGDLPSFKLADNPFEPPKRGQKKDIKPVPELNIAGAIEAYLQYKLQHTPEYHGRSIHIYPSPDGGVSIEVDGRYYDAVGDIQDAEIRAFIATAIEEWQERH